MRWISEAPLASGTMLFWLFHLDWLLVSGLNIHLSLLFLQNCTQDHDHNLYQLWIKSTLHVILCQTTQQMEANFQIYHWWIFSAWPKLLSRAMIHELMKLFRYFPPTLVQEVFSLPFLLLCSLHGYYMLVVLFRTIYKTLIEVGAW